MDIRFSMILSAWLLCFSGAALADAGDQVADRLDDLGDRIDRRLDKRGQRVDRQRDRRGAREKRRD